MQASWISPSRPIDYVAERARWQALSGPPGSPSASSLGKPPANATMSDRQAYVLAVDDDSTILRMVELACRPFDVEVSLRVASSVHAAIDLAKRLRFDMILLDNELEGVRGWELLDYLRPQLAGQAPVVVYSGNLDARARAEYARRQVTTILEKPLSPVALGFWIRQSLGL